MKHNDIAQTIKIFPFFLAMVEISPEHGCNAKVMNEELHISSFLSLLSACFIPLWVPERIWLTVKIVHSLFTCQI